MIYLPATLALWTRAAASRRLSTCRGTMMLGNLQSPGHPLGWRLSSRPLQQHADGLPASSVVAGYHLHPLRAPSVQPLPVQQPLSTFTSSKLHLRPTTHTGQSHGCHSRDRGSSTTLRAIRCGGFTALLTLNVGSRVSSILVLPWVACPAFKP